MISGWVLGMRRIAALLCFGLGWLGLAQSAGAARGQQPEAPQRPLTIGYVELQGDMRYRVLPSRPGANADRPASRQPARPYAGAELAIADGAFVGQAIGVKFGLRRASAPDVKTLAQIVARWTSEGIHFVVADLPASALLGLADQIKNRPVLLLNASAPADSLRGRDCRRNVAHTLPSQAMRADALAQFLVSKHWRDILILHGSRPEDEAATAALERSAKKFGAKIVASKPFQLTNDPRRRDESNVALMTAGESYDIVAAIDIDGRFARYVPYQTKDPRPVVGATGLVARAWHWSWDQHGARQLNDRFERANGRPMRSADWAAWAAVKAVQQSVLRTNATDFAAVRTYLLGAEMNLDGYKGNPMSFRAWDHQLRQPMLLATANAVIARAPLPGFLHRTNELDTLGFDQPESACAF